MPTEVVPSYEETSPLASDIPKYEDSRPIQKLNRTQLAALPQFQMEKVPLATRIGATLESVMNLEPYTAHGMLSQGNRLRGLPDPDTKFSFLDPYLDTPDRSGPLPNVVRPNVIKMKDVHPSLVGGIQESMREGVRHLTTPEAMVELPGVIESAPVRLLMALQQMYQSGQDIATAPERYKEITSQPGATAGDVSKQATTDIGHLLLGAGLARSVAPRVPAGTGITPEVGPTPPTLMLPPGPPPPLQLGPGTPLRMPPSSLPVKPLVGDAPPLIGQRPIRIEQQVLMPVEGKPGGPLIVPEGAPVRERPVEEAQVPYPSANPLRYSKQVYDQPKPETEKPGQVPKREVLPTLPPTQLLHSGADMDAIKQKLQGAVGRSMIQIAHAQKKEQESEYKPGRVSSEIVDEMVTEYRRKSGGLNPPGPGVEAMHTAAALFERGYDNALDPYEAVFGPEFVDELKVRAAAVKNIYADKFEEVKDVSDAAVKKGVFKLEERAAYERPEMHSGAPIKPEDLAKLGGTQDATRKLRTSDIPEGEPPGNLPKVGSEVRPGAETQGPTRQEKTQGEIEYLHAGASLGESWKKLMTSLRSDRSVVMTAMSSKARDVKNLMSERRDAVDNAPLLTQERAESRINLTTERLFGKQANQAKAAALVIEDAKGNRAALPGLEAQAVRAGWDEGAKAARFADANWDRLQPIVKDAHDIDMMNVTSAVFHGLRMPDMEAYRKESYDNPQRGIVFKEPIDPTRGRIGSYPNMFDAAEAGVKIESMDLAGLVGKRTNQLQHKINFRLWTEALKRTDFKGNKIIVDVPRKSGGPPPGYDMVEVTPGQRVAVFHPFVPLFKALVSESHMTSSLPGRALMHGVGTIKHGTLAFDSFHLSRIFQFYQSLDPGGNLNLAKPILSFSKGDLAEALRQKKITQAQYDYANESIDLLQGKITRYEVNSYAVRSGANIGKHSEALYSDFIRSFPGFKQTFGAANRFIFDVVSRRALTKAFQVEFERVANNNPTWTFDKVGRSVARDLNFRFGNLGRQGFFRSRTAQDIMQVFFMAPRWVESMARSETGSAAQLVKASIPGEDFGKVPTLLKSTTAILATYFAVSQALNYWSTGHPTWENEKGHELDLWVPPVTKGGKGYWVSALSVGAELTHDVVRYNRQGKGALGIAGTMLENKFSNVSRAADVAFTGGPMNRGTADPLGGVTELVNPTPLLGRQLAKAKSTKDITPAIRQGFSTVGLKAEPESAEEVIARETEGMDLKERKGYEVERKKKLHEKDSLLSEDERRTSKIHGAERSIENIMRRGSELSGMMTKADQQWLKSRDLLVPGIDNKISVRGQKIVLSKKETDRLAELTKTAYEEFSMPLLRKRFDNIDEGAHNEFYTEVMAHARDMARQQLMKEIQSKAKPGRKRQSAFEP